MLPEAHPRQIAENLLVQGPRRLGIHVSFAFRSFMHAAFSLTTLSLVTNQGRPAMAVKATPQTRIGLNGLQLLGFLLGR